ncbi:ParB/RepB/Spo0J family partition protein [Acidovorax sp. SUPP2825]|uniref:ParB/RepB/Spo0J family partition protein n=1 Tax=Acidovorax sp. SUPP2825 TaxID=2920879 RepID=UPI0023DE5D51|nr:ParB/RepB/Spo0J family partition protein [Acidovorax sp. SUPP2825]GKS96918.1 ParB/RepB/Spo0J family partition protein [Acidovorax sp. SUPP2825]
MPPKSDSLIKRQVRINDDATSPKGKLLAQAGKDGKVLGRTPGGKQYQVEVEGTVINLTMDNFVVLPHDGLPAEAPPASNGAYLPISQLAPSKTNRKAFEPEAMQLLAASIKTYGILQPLLIRPLPSYRLQETFGDPETRHATHEIIAGERRYRAARIAGLSVLPVLIKTVDGALPQVMQLLENIQREDLKPLDEALGIEALVQEHGYTRDQIAEALGRSRSHVFESQRLLHLCPDAIAALQSGSLTRSVALIVAQRPTAALQTEFTQRVLTGGPDGGPMSYRSAKDLAARSYQTDLAGAPFALDDAALCAKAGACSRCPKRTGATPELFDRSHADVCTDVACFGAKKEAHFEEMAAQARQNGRKVITGKEARELMPNEGVAPAGYMLLDKPARRGESESLRSLVGAEVSPDKVVLIESPSGNMVEAIPTRAAGAALENKSKSTPAASKGKDKGPTAAELSEAYQGTWRRLAIDQIIEGLRTAAEPDALDRLPRQVVYRLMLTMANDVDDETVRKTFQLSPGFSIESLRAAVSSASEQPLRVQNMVLMMLVTGYDQMPLYERPVDEAQHIDATAAIAKVDVKSIQSKVQAQMKSKAAERGTSDKPNQIDAAKPSLKSKTDKPAKTTKAEAQAAIAQAMNEAPATNSFSPGDKVRIRIDLKGPDKDWPLAKLLPTKGRTAVIRSKTGDRAWMLDLPVDSKANDTDKVERWTLIADYTELEALND